MIKQSDAINELAAALAKAQGAIPPAAKNGYNPHFKNKFATFEDIRAAVQKPFSDNGLSYSQLPEFGEDGFVLWTYLFHESGQYIACDFPLNPGNASNPMQALGSAMSYARRYTLGSISGASAENDDDGNDSSEVKPAKKQQPKNGKPLAEIKDDFFYSMYQQTGKDEKACKAILKDSGFTSFKVEDIPKMTAVIIETAEMNQEPPRFPEMEELPVTGYEEV